jgi:hypothetical protein
MGYVIFDPKVNRPLHELPREDARAAYDWFVDNISARLNQLSQLVSVDEIDLDFSESSLIRLHDWFFKLVIEERGLENSTPSPELFSVCNDIGIFLSEFVIREGKQIKWLFFTKDEKGLSYQRPVISGFNVKNKDYYIDFDYLICQYAFRILKTGSKEDELFGAMIKRAFTLL